MSISKKFQEFLEDGDLFFPLSKWPPIAQGYMLKLHKLRNERYYLMRFFVYNGLQPNVASNWILREGEYDDNALRDQKGMIEKAKTTDFFRVGKIFNMRYGRTDSWNDPPAETSQWDTPPPGGYHLKREPPPPTPTKPEPKDDKFELAIARFPRPMPAMFEDKFDYELALATWRVEMRRYTKYLEQQGM